MATTRAQAEQQEYEVSKTDVFKTDEHSTDEDKIHEDQIDAEGEIHEGGKVAQAGIDLLPIEEVKIDDHKIHDKIEDEIGDKIEDKINDRINDKIEDQIEDKFEDTVEDKIDDDKVDGKTEAMSDEAYEIDECAICDDDSSDWELSDDEEDDSSVSEEMTFRRIAWRPSLICAPSLISMLHYQAIEDAKLASQCSPESSPDSSPGPNPTLTLGSVSGAPASTSESTSASNPGSNPGTTSESTTKSTPESATAPPKAQSSLDSEKRRLPINPGLHQCLSPQQVRQQMIANELGGSTLSHDLVWEHKQNKSRPDPRRMPRLDQSGKDSKIYGANVNMYFTPCLSDYHSKGWQCRASFAVPPTTTSMQVSLEGTAVCSSSCLAPVVFPLDRLVSAVLPTQH
ncbi:hypothetical protein BJ875DRAFT_203397 [Amylocarpus encephaloides]|uniref:DUF3295 domain-containing protein n=1 Tax=Amylocarpus encephaloides TaxID=45428 RepID=A0A9P7Y8U5_9HELO|nr:hypothetical protein BJ875DRAFT_203397 [Amylocarpus encephaloides]